MSGAANPCPLTARREVLYTKSSSARLARDVSQVFTCEQPSADVPLKSVLLLTPAPRTGLLHEAPANLSSPLVHLRVVQQRLPEDHEDVPDEAPQLSEKTQHHFTLSFTVSTGGIHTQSDELSARRTRREQPLSEQ